MLWGRGGRARQMKNVVIVQTERVEGRCGVRYVGRPDGVRRSAATNMGCLLSLSLFIFISFERP